ncbi:MarR family winged helix-turn-helix transcriptional regulator [Streptomyces avicenniae]|uniref:MarR family winged helix-turn-helix transcriptional regulator n=1 Tax=Streptomyces avicenniae TaxID=500153 RepID=UPI00069BF8CD|nr:MarR family transcriptional regulator [Streptomyces avicenniae]
MTEHGGTSHLIVRLAHAHRNAAAALLQPLGLHPGQELVLMRLGEEDGQPQSRLVHALDLDPSTVSRTVQRLERKGLLTRAPSPADRRAVLVTLTPEGRALLPGVHAAWAALDAATARGLSERRRAEAVRLLRHLERGLAEAPARPADDARGDDARA